MIIYITEAFAFLIKWTSCWPYLVILPIVNQSCVPSFFSTENGSWMSLLTAEWHPQSAVKVLIVAMWHFLKREFKRYIIGHDKVIPTSCLLSLSFILQSTIKLIYLKHSSDHVITIENISTIPHSLHNKFFIRKDR